MTYIVLKFGGTSISLKGVLTMVEQLEKYQNIKVIIVLSAKSQVTNLLTEGKNIEAYEIYKDFCKELNIDEIEYMKELKSTIGISNKSISLGELISSKLISNFINESGIENKWINSLDFMYSEINRNDKYEFKINDYKFPDNKIVIVPGFISMNCFDEIILMSRGGSDTTGSIISGHVHAERYEIWTDVDGVYSIDPNIIKNNLIIPHLSYELAQEISALGAKVLHPYCIKTIEKHNIPICIKNTFNSNSTNNTIINNVKQTDCSLLIEQKHNILINIKSIEMWNEYGFVSDIFQVFKNLSINVDIISTSQFSVSITTNKLSNETIKHLKQQLDGKYIVSINENISVLSLITSNINKSSDTVNNLKNIINKLTNDYLVHYGANNYNVSFIVNKTLVKNIFVDFYNTLYKVHKIVDTKDDWINDKIETLKDMYIQIKEVNFLRQPKYIYNTKILQNSIDKLKEITNIDEWFYSIKANNNETICNIITNNRFNFESVSIDELKYIYNTLQYTGKTLFTPNYCNILEYESAFKLNKNIIVIVDNVDTIITHPIIFENKSIGVRLDLDSGDGHCSKVITSGVNSKFGISLNRIDELINICNIHNINIIGLHTHQGSGIVNIKTWEKVLNKIVLIKDKFENIEWIDLGGGIGINYESDIDTLDLHELNNLIGKYKNKLNTKLYMEPGRFVVARCGILLGEVTQISNKGSINYLGVNVGMNTLMRPTLYNSYHRIINISKINEKKNTEYTVVGPICESGDILGKNRILPKCDIGDVILIKDVGAYGHVMSNTYNMRQSALEYIIH
jgi:diaminopimelate decarboxylase/aspartate kinase